MVSTSDQFIPPANGYGRASPPSSRPPRPKPPAAAAFAPEQAALPLEPPPPPPEVAEPVAQKKKKKQSKISSLETRQVAIARIQKLVAAGNGVGAATAKVAKELGVTKSAVDKWRQRAGETKAPDAPAAPKARAARAAKAPDAPAHPAHPGGPPSPGGELSQRELASIGEAFILLLASALDKPVRNIVAEELRRRLS